MSTARFELLLALGLSAVAVGLKPASGQWDGPWKMHVIDDSSRGADGVRLGDFNRDQLADIVTGWEEGGVIRVYQNPGPGKTKNKWPAVTVGRVKSPEDAVFADLDQDGQLDVVSCCEGKTKSVHVHWAPAKGSRYLDPEGWKTESFGAVQSLYPWMFAVVCQIDGKHGVDLFLGSKGGNGCVGWLESPPDPRQVEKWKFHKIQDAGWIMSLKLLPGSDSIRLLVSDRKGSKRGVYVLEKPANLDDSWKRIDINHQPHEFMFLDAKVSGRQTEIVVATRNSRILVYRANQGLSGFSVSEAPNPDGIKFGKAIAVGDIDLDGKPDWVHTSNTRFLPQPSKVPGIHWIKTSGGKFVSRPIGNHVGKKYDRIELLDLDADGDLDVLTCEEAANLGVIWFENPAR